MRLQVKKADLLKELRILGSVLDRRSAAVASGYILCSAEHDGDGGRLRMVATNLDTTVSTFCPAEVEETGCELLPGRQWVAVTRLLADESIGLLTNGVSGVQVKSETGRFRFFGPAPETFPTLPAMPEPAFELPPAALHQALQGIHFAMSQDETRYNLAVVQGVVMRSEGASDTDGLADLQLAATDGHRLAVAWLRRAVKDLKGTLTAEAPRQLFLLPHRGVTDLRHLLSAVPEGELKFGIGDRSLSFLSGHRQLFVQQGSGLFPSINSVLYPPTPLQASLPVKELTACLRRMLPVADNMFPAVTLLLRPGQLELAAVSSEVGDGTERLDITFDGPSVRLLFNPHYLLDILGAVDCGTLTMLFKDEISAVVFEPVPSDGNAGPAPAFRHVVMPLSPQARAAASGA